MRVATLFQQSQTCRVDGRYQRAFPPNGAHTTQFHYKYPTHAQFHTNARLTRSFTQTPGTHAVSRRHSRLQPRHPFLSAGAHPLFS